MLESGREITEFCFIAEKNEELVLNKHESLAEKVSKGSMGREGIAWFLLVKCKRKEISDAFTSQGPLRNASRHEEVETSPRRFRKYVFCQPLTPRTMGL